MEEYDNQYVNYPQTPWYEEKENWLYIGGGLLLIVLIVLGSVWFVRSRSAARRAAVERHELVETVNGHMESRLPECEAVPDPSACKKDLIIDSAVQAKSVEMCERLDGADRVQCATRVAVTARDLRLCLQDVSEEDRVSCEDRVWLKLNLENKDYGSCERIADASIRVTCEGQLIGFALQTMPCAETGASEAFCTTIAVTQEAVETGDPSLCERIGETLGKDGECEQTVMASDFDRDRLSLFGEREAGTDPNNPDTDGDGLSDGREVDGVSDPLDPDSDDDGLPDGEEVLLWGTDPLDGDSDGDGFGDGEEVQNGYNPLGEGRLE